LAGLKRHIIDNELIGARKKFVVVVSGANMNFDRLRFVAERAELGEGREVLLSVKIPEQPGRYVPSPSLCLRILNISCTVSSRCTPSSIPAPSQSSSTVITRLTKLMFSCRSYWSRRPGGPKFQAYCRLLMPRV